MIKILSFSLLLALVISLLLPGVAAAALPCPPKILEECYKSCRESFTSDLLRTSCYCGCLIGCITSGID